MFRRRLIGMRSRPKDWATSFSVRLTPVMLPSSGGQRLFRSCTRTYDARCSVGFRIWCTTRLHLTSSKSSRAHMDGNIPGDGSAALMPNIRLLRARTVGSVFPG